MLRSDESSIHSGAFSSSLPTLTTFAQSLPTWPLRSLSLGIRARLAIRRWASSESDISSEKKATGRSSWTETCSAMLATKPDLPIPGRAARMIRLPGWKPPVILSRWSNPDGVPLSSARPLASSSSRSTSRETISEISWKSSACSSWAT